MSYEQRIRAARSGMSKSFGRLADFILDSYIQSALMTATEVAHQVDVDAATVVRFAQMLEYSGFPELQREIKERVMHDLLIRPQAAQEPDSISGVVDATLTRLREAIEQTRMLLDGEVVAELVERIGAARRIIVMPESLGQAAAYTLVTLLEQGGFLVSVAQYGVTDLARTVSAATEDDLLVAIDVAGEAPFIARALREASMKGIPTATIAGAASLESARVADLVLAGQNQPDIGTGIVVADAIVYTLAEALRWQYEERFQGADEAIGALFERIKVGGD
ncbi:MAG: MurR/RpiR family transcriptional regulator [Chloroflexi bacterium]|nr:MurR/RpiR family transcriptional regulator [Chloroflexota bacterium]